MTARSLFYLCAANVLGGSAYVAAAYALRGFSPQEVVLWRTVVGLLVLGPLVWRAARGLRLSRADWVRMAGVGWLGYAAPLVIGTIGQELSSATNASLLIGAEPISILVMSIVLLGEPLSAVKAAAIAAGVAGSAIITLQGIPFVNGSVTPHLRGDLLLIFHGFLFALYSIIGKPVLRTVDPVAFSGITTALALLPIAAVTTRESPIAAAPPEALAALAYLGLGVTALGTITWNKALEAVPASTIANFVFLQPLVGVLLGTLLHGESFTAWSALGGALIVAGAWASAREG